MTPLGRPVVPEVYRRERISSMLMFSYLAGGIAVVSFRPAKKLGS